MPLSRNGIKTMIGRGEPKIGRAERSERKGDTNWVGR